MADTEKKVMIVLSADVSSAVSEINTVTGALSDIDGAANISVTADVAGAVRNIQEVDKEMENVTGGVKKDTTVSVTADVASAVDGLQTVDEGLTSAEGEKQISVTADVAVAVEAINTAELTLQEVPDGKNINISVGSQNAVSDIRQVGRQANGLPHTKNISVVASVDAALAKIALVNSKVQGVAATVTGAFGGMGGIAGMAGFAGAVTVLGQIAKKGDDIGEGAQRIGVTTDEYQRLMDVQDKTGAGAGAVEAAFRIMKQGLYGVDEESIKAQQTIGLLGLSLDELKNKSPEQKFATIAAALRNIKDDTERANLATQIFGRQSQSLLPMIDVYDKMKNDIDEVGGVMSGKSIDAADKLADSIKNLTSSFQNVVAESGFLKYLGDIAGEMEAIVKLSNGFAEKKGVTEKNVEKSGLEKNIISVAKIIPALAPAAYAYDSYKWIQNKTQPGITSAPASTKAEVDKKLADKAAKEAEAAKATQRRADAQVLSASEEQVKSIMKTLDGREKEKKAVDNILEEMQQQIKLQDLLAAGKEKEAFIQDQIYKAQKAHAENPMDDKQRKTIVDAAVKLPAAERQAFVEGEFDKFNKSRPENTLPPDESKKISGLADQIFTGKKDQATNDALKEMQEQVRLQQLINDGKGRQAFIEEQLAKLAKDRGEALSDESKINVSDMAGKLYDLKNKAGGLDGQKEAPNVDQFAKLGLYNFGEGISKSLDVERNSLLKQIAAKVGLPVIQEVLA